MLAVILLVSQDPNGIEFFEKKIRPILVEKCYECHSARSKKLKGGLLLDSRDGMLKGGNQGPALVLGSPEKSLFVRAIGWKDEDLQMPPKQKLSEAQIADLTAWVKMGAPASADFALATAGKPDPRTARAAAAHAKRVGMSVAEGKKFWAYRPPVKPSLPAVRNTPWPKNDIDRFVLARLEANGLPPAPPAERPILIRRLYYDLAGLPPSPEDVDAFMKDTSSDAYERVVERLLAASQFGERWGRHWLDVARFA